MGNWRFCLAVFMLYYGVKNYDNYPIDGGPDSPLSTPVVKAPDDPNFSKEPLEAAVEI